jgi:hypothetical protein
VLSFHLPPSRPQPPLNTNPKLPHKQNELKKYTMNKEKNKHTNCKKITNGIRVVCVGAHLSLVHLAKPKLVGSGGTLIFGFSGK